MRAVIVSHGQPGNPAPQQRAIEELADLVSQNDPGCEVVGATLAMPEALATLRHDGAVIYPMFMAEGWFTGTELPRRLAADGYRNTRIMPPFGTEPALPGLITDKVAQAAAAEGWQLPETTLLLSAHGSGRSQASFNITNALAARLAPGFARVITGFVEQPPYIADAARGLVRAVSLPLFALQAEHVTGDLPVALDQAGFTGPRLDPIGTVAEVPALIAASVRAYTASV